jgi:hypothetical protein
VIVVIIYILVTTAVETGIAPLVKDTNVNNGSKHEKVNF